MNFHPLAELFPLMQGREFDELVTDIKANGLREPIWTYQGQILDGRNRWRACEAAKLSHRPMREYTGDDPVSFVVSLNLHRRHLDESQRGMAARRLASVRQGARTDLEPRANLPEVSQSKAAELLNVSERTVKTAGKVIDHGAPELVQAVDHGRVSVSAAADVAELPREEQREIVAKGEKEILEAAKQIRLKKAVARREENAKLLANAPPPPDGKFRAIVIDPPWKMEKIERDVHPEQVAFEYPTMSEADLASFDVSGMADEDCHLFCWTTHKHLPVALRLLEAWGFRYVCTMVWHKNGGFQPFGLPQYNCEFVLYARRGTPEFAETKQFMCCFNAPRREHSRKPDEFYDVVRRVTPGPRIDVFSREAREGFVTWGNETNKFGDAA